MNTSSTDLTQPTDTLRKQISNSLEGAQAQKQQLTFNFTQPAIVFRHLITIELYRPKSLDSYQQWFNAFVE
ncbi:MAG: hypothetical protein ACRCZS_08310 [Chroococcidiopsis sp.]